MATAGGVKLNCSDLLTYLQTLSPVLLGKLYGYPSTCLAVFRELPELCKLFIMRMLFIEQPISKQVAVSWLSTPHHREYVVASDKLSDLHIWQTAQIGGGISGWSLHSAFRRSMKTAFLGGEKSSAAQPDLGVDKHAKGVDFLNSYALERWECILHFMVGSREAADGVSRDVVEILLHSGLMKSETPDGAPVITQAGFQFLLMDTQSQVWHFMLQYLDTVQSRGQDLVKLLSFLFQLSFSTLGKDYSSEGLEEELLKFLQHLREFGLVFQRKRKCQRYYPTHLAINLGSGLSQGGDTHRQGFLVVETNYRVYAYTESSLQVALLGLFCDLMYRFPNLTVGQITRDSVRQALLCGITAEQIINFLRGHAHSEMLKQKPVLPPTISDQIRLWELERDRFKFNDGVLYSQFLSQTDFELLRDFARDLGVLTWENPAQRVMVVTKDGHDDVKKFWKRQKKENS